MSRGLWWCLVAAVLLVVAPASAAPPREKPDLVLDAVLEKMKVGDLQGARLQLDRAIMLEATPRRLYHLFLVERELGHSGAALRAWRRLFAHPEVDRKKLAGFENIVEDLVGATARVIVDAPQGSIVAVDDYAGDAPLPFPIDLDPGEKVVQLKIGGHQVAVRTLSLKAGDHVSITLRAPASPPPPSDGVVAKNLPPTVPASPPSGDSYRPVAGYVVPSAILGGAAVALGFGVGYAVASTHAYDEAAAKGPGACVDPSSTSCAEHIARVDHVNALHDTSIGFYVASGVLAAGAIVTFLVWPSSRRELRLTASPTGLGVVGRF